MRVLIVGAGAIGRVYGHAFAEGGAEVAFVVRPYQAASAREGWTLYGLNRSSTRRHHPISFSGFEVHTSVEAALSREWDLVVLAVTSLSLREGDWLERLGQGLGAGFVLSLLPGSDNSPAIK